MAVIALAYGDPGCSATEYYVDQKNPRAADTNPGNVALPWRTIGKAANEATAGDTVWIKEGTYREEVTHFANSGEYYGSEMRFITLAAFENDTVVIEGTRQIEPGEWQPQEDMQQVFFLALPEDPNQVFFDGKRLPESVAVVADKQADVERATSRAETHSDQPLTDTSTGRWFYDAKRRRLYVNTGEGNPSVGHRVEVPVYSFSVNLRPRPGTRYDGRGVSSTAIRLRGLTFNRLRTGLHGGTMFSVIEDCVVRQAGGISALSLRGMHNIIRRNTVLDSYHQAIYWNGSNFVLEDNLVVGAMKDPYIVTSAWEGVFKTNEGAYSTIRNNVIAEIEASEHHDGGLGIWCDIASDFNAIYGNVSYRQNMGIYVEQSQNANVIVYNTCFDNKTGIGVRNNSHNLILGNYLFNNRNVGIWYGSENRYPPMTGQRVEGNWIVNNPTGVLVSLSAPFGWNTVSLDRNTYTRQDGATLVKWGEKAFTDLASLRRETGQEFQGTETVRFGLGDGGGLASNVIDTPSSHAAHSITLIVAVGGSTVLTVTNDIGVTYTATPTLSGATHTLGCSGTPTATQYFAALAYLLNQLDDVSAVANGASSVIITADAKATSTYDIGVTGTAIVGGHFASTATAGSSSVNPTNEVTDADIQVIKFRVSHSRTPEMLVPMVANPTLLRAAPSGVGGYANRPYFWRHGNGSGLSFGAGAAGPWSVTSGTIRTSYPNLPRLWANGGSYVAGIIAVMLGPDGRPLEKHEGPGEKRWGVYVKGTQPDDIHPLGEGWWSPSLPTVTGTRYRISWQSRAEELQPAAGDPRSGPVVFVQWTNDTGQKLVRHYLWGTDDSGKPHGKLARKGSYPWTGDGGEVTAPEGATRVRFFFGLRRCKGMVKYRDMHITAS